MSIATKRLWRLSFILSSLWLSGGVRVVVEYANRLANRGHQITLIIPGKTFDADMACELNPQIDVLQSQIVRKPKMTFLQNTQLAWSLAAAVPAADFVISTHTPTTLPGFFATKLLRRGRPLWLYQDYQEMFTGRPLEIWLLRHALRWQAGALVVSQYCAEELRKYTPGCIRVIGEGLSHPEFFQPNPLAARLPENRYTILFLGDMRPRKGLYDFLEAMQLVQQQLPEIKLWIVSKEACEIETTVPFELIYRPSRAHLAKLYRNCHLFVSASWWESFGLPPLEAMACGAPVVLTNSGGVLDYAKAGQNCLIVPARNPLQLAGAVLNVLTDDALATRLSHNGPNTIAPYDWETAVDRFEACLQEFAA
ncbi:MAG: glycosyltransferase family 4 protein [Caldilineaceae bacterium]